jgi:predicted dinucleotide-binding enzyme
MSTIAYFPVARTRRIDRSGAEGESYMSVRRRLATLVARSLGPCSRTEKPSHHRKSPVKTLLTIEIRDRLRVPLFRTLRALVEICRRSVMSYSIIGTGSVGSTLASFFAKAGIEVGLANTKGAEVVEPLAGKLGQSVVAKSLDDALKADVIFFALQFLQFKNAASALSDWTGKIVIDVTNAFKLPPEVLEAELNGRLSSEVNAERVPGAKLVKAFNQLPMNVLSRPVPAGGRRVVFISSDDEDASAKVARLAEELGFAPIEVGKIDGGGRLIQVGNALAYQDLIKFEKR